MRRGGHHGGRETEGGELVSAGIRNRKVVVQLKVVARREFGVCGWWTGAGPSRSEF